jgi:hypothetical protein
MAVMKQAREDQSPTWLWDAVERSRGGNERRRRLMSRMTESEAHQWAITHEAHLHRVDESTPHSGIRVRASARHHR